MKDGHERKRARGIDRAFDILDHLRAVKTPQRPVDIAQALGAPKSTIYDLVGTLLGQGMLEETDAGGTVFLGRRLYFLGLAYSEYFDLSHKVESLMHEITERTSETTQFCMIDGDKYTVAVQVEGNRPFRISGDIGDRTPIPWTASGRLLLGDMSDEEIIDLIPPEDFDLPSGERVDVAGYLAEIREAREAGFFSFDSIVDSFTHCLAAPVCDATGKCVATICIVAPKDDAAKHYDSYRAMLIEAGHTLSKSIP